MAQKAGEPPPACHKGHGDGTPSSASLLQQAEPCGLSHSLAPCHQHGPKLAPRGLCAGTGPGTGTVSASLVPRCCFPLPHLMGRVEESPLTALPPCWRLSCTLRGVSRVLGCCWGLRRGWKHRFRSALMVCVSVLQGHHGTVHHPHRADRGGGDPTQPDGKSQQEGAAAALLPSLAHGLGTGPGAWGCSTHCHVTSRAELVLVGCQQGSAGAGLGSPRSCP